MGKDKSMMILGGKPRLAHVIARLAPQVARVAINTNMDISRFNAFDLPVIADTVPDRPGPLAGLLAGMEWASQEGARHIVTAPTDSPFLPADLVGRLMAVSQKASRPALAASGGRRHPVVGIWPVELAGSLRDFLTSGETYKASVFADRHGAVQTDFPMIELAGHEIDPFFNVNTLDDFAEAEIILEEMKR